MKKKIFNNEKRNKFILYCGLFLFLILIHTFFKLNVGDDIYFSNTQLSNIFPFLGFRYQQWSSRIFIEFVLITMCHLPHVCWYIIDSLMIVLVIYSMNKLFSKKGIYFIILTFLLFFLYPISYLKEAGWYATTINYLWPFACALFSLIPLKNSLNDTKNNKYMYPLYMLATLFACSQELICAIMLGVYLIYLCVLYKNKKVNKFIIVQLSLIIISLFIFLMCPGNEIRKLDEISNRYVAYESFTILQKLVLGLFSTFSFIFEKYIIALIILLFLLHFIGAKNNNEFLKINSALPLLMYLGYKLIPNNIYIKQYIISFLNQQDIIYVFTKSNILIIMFIIIFVLSITINLYYIFKNSKNLTFKFTPIIIFLAGIASRIMMGFSPTIYASGIRTFMFFYFSLIICILLILNEILNSNNKKNMVYALLILICLDLLQGYYLLKF